MVEYILDLNSVFGALADPTRRDILQRVSQRTLSIGEIAKHYELTFAAISKHLKVMEKAQLIVKRRSGKEQIVTIAPQALKSADDYLEFYRQLWQERLDSLDIYLKQSERSQHE